MGNVCWLNDNVVGFGHTDAKLIGLNRAYRLAVSGNNRHRKPRDTHIKEGHGRGVDEPQANFFAWLEQSRPVGCRGRTIHQVGIFRTRDIQNIPGTHAHLAPHVGFAPGGTPAHVFYIFEEITNGALVVVVIAFSHLEVTKYIAGSIEGPVRQHHHVFTLIGDRLGLGRVNDYRPIMAKLLLKAGMAMVPVGTVLLDREAVLEGFARLDAGKTDPGNTVHLKRQ